MPNIALLGGTPGWVLGGASADFDFVNNRAWATGRNAPPSSFLSISRASSGLGQQADGTWVSFSSNMLRNTNKGALIEEARTNLFLNSAAPVTQTVTVVSSSVYTVSVYGTASVVLTGAATGTAAQGSPVTFTAATTSLVCTVAGAGGTFQNVQVELGAFATSPIVTTGASATRAADVITLSGAALTAALNAKAARFETNLIASGSTLDTFVGYNSNHNMRFNSSTTVVINNGVNTLPAATLGGGTNNAGLVKTAFGFDAVSMTGLANGGTQTTSANAWGVPTSPVWIGSLGGNSRFINGYMRRLTFGNTKGQFDGLTQ